LVYLQEKGVVFRVSFIELSKVDAHSLLVILLLYEDWVSESVQVKHLSNETSSKKTVDLATESLAPLLIHLPWLLFHQPDPGLMASRWQMMTGLMPGKSVGAHANTSGCRRGIA